ncbi:uncharacterized protein LOC124116672 [Haliotis rufescens]|uniref:uncharacterized protein LOC124116672 n=1 Tax=Haliotis rufescens TaxID=6454 RepID=UPI00201E7D5A|nr:uncharacterized protein LOC124116672 [Haliotis rufescens]
MKMLRSFGSIWDHRLRSSLLVHEQSSEPYGVAQSQETKVLGTIPWDATDLEYLVGSGQPATPHHRSRTVMLLFFQVLMELTLRSSQNRARYKVMTRYQHKWQVQQRARYRHKCKGECSSTGRVVMAVFGCRARQQFDVFADDDSNGLKQVKMMMSHTG